MFVGILYCLYWIQRTKYLTKLLYNCWNNVNVVSSFRNDNATLHNTLLRRLFVNVDCLLIWIFFPTIVIILVTDY